MELGDLRGLSTIFCLIAFVAVVYWAYGPSRKKYFEQASRLPFSEDELDHHTTDSSVPESTSQSQSQSQSLSTQSTQSKQSKSMPASKKENQQ